MGSVAQWYTLCLGCESKFDLQPLFKPKRLYVWKSKKSLQVNLYKILIIQVLGEFAFIFWGGGGGGSKCTVLAF